MFAHVLFLCTAVVGTDVGWQPLQEGGMEYVIQLDPQSLEALKAGEPIQCDILPGAGEVRSFKFYLGGDKPQRIGRLENRSSGNRSMPPKAAGCRL